MSWNPPTWSNAECMYSRFSATYVSKPPNTPPQEVPESKNLKCGLSHDPPGLSLELKTSNASGTKPKVQISDSRKLSVLKPPRCPKLRKSQPQNACSAPDFKSPAPSESLPLIPIKMFQNHENLQTSKCYYKAQIPHKSVCLRSLS